MAQMRIQLRDLEILRTLLRLRYLRTTEILSVFFPGDRSARRRLQKLSDAGFIRPHSKGIPGGLPYSAWRLTSHGVELVQREFPEEVCPDDLAEKLGHHTLTNIAHREQISRVYLELLAAAAPASPQERPTYFAALRRRADQITWAADGDVALEYTHLGQPQQVLPDAALVSSQRRVRVFLELDRSTRTLTRVKTNLERYKQFLRGNYAEAFHDAYEPWVVYVVKSDSRLANVSDCAKRILGDSCRWTVLRPSTTTAWLEALVFDVVAAHSVAVDNDSADKAQAQLLRSIYTFANGCLTRLQEQGLLPALKEKDPKFFNHGTRLMREVYQRLRESQSEITNAP